MVLERLLELPKNADLIGSFIASLGPTIWRRHRETSGLTAFDSSGNGFHGTIAGTGSIGQPGALGANEAIDLVSGRVYVANNPAFANLAAFTYAFLVNPDTAGNLSFGVFSAFGNGNGENAKHLVFNAALTSLSARIYNTTPTDFTTNTTTGFSAGAWAWLFWQFDNAGDRKSHLFKGISGAVTEFAYSAQPALTGTLKNDSQELNMGSYSSGSLAFDGKFDEFMVFPSILSSANMQEIVRLSNV